MREHWNRTLILEMEFKTIQLPSCFGSKEFNEGSAICKACNQLEECKKRIKEIVI